MAIRKPFSHRRLALNISQVCATIELRAKANELSTEEALHYLARMAQLLPGYGKLLESVDTERRLRELEKLLKEKEGNR